MRINKVARSIIIYILIITMVLVGSSVVFAEPDEGVIDPGETVPPVVDNATEPEETVPPVVDNVTNPGETAPSANNTGGSLVKIDTRLSSLNMSCGALVPAFSPDIYEYTVYISDGQENKECTTVAMPINVAARVTAEGPKTIEKEDVVKKVISIGPSGEKSEYIINIHIIRKNELLVENKLYKISDNPDISLLPAGLKVYTYELNGEKIKVAKVAKERNNKLLFLQYVNVSDEKDYLWYSLNTSNKSVYPIEVKEVEGRNSIVISSGVDLIYNDGPEGTGYYVYNPNNNKFEYIVPEEDSKLSQDNILDYHSVIYYGLIISTAVALCAVASCIFLYKKAKRLDKKESKYFRPYIAVQEKNISEQNNN